MSTSMFTKISLIAKDSKGEPQTLSRTGVVLAAVCLAVIPLEISHLVFALVGAFAYAVLTQGQQQQANANKSRSASSKTYSLPKRKINGRDEVSPRDKARSPQVTASRVPKVARQEVANSKLVLQPSICPISAPVFNATGWDAEVEELLAQISPTVENQKAIQQLAHSVQQTIRALVPEIEVVGFASSNFSRGTAFGVAVPEVDLVATLSSDELARRFLRRNAQPSALKSDDLRKLHKTAVRICTDKLVSAEGFKFRRSAFRGHEPKVTMLAPMRIGSSEVAIPVDFAVNSATPFSNAALLAECGRIEPKAKSLILLVKRWAKDRGISHVAKGHFSPYAWSLLATYFLQSGASSDGAVLPPMGKFAASRKSAKTSEANASGSKPACEDKPSLSSKSVGCLFQEFISFYATDFDWHNEAVSVRLGKRAQPELSLPLHIVLDEATGTSEAGPSVEDPFEISHNLGDSMNSSSLARLHEELARAQRLCSQNVSLTELLQPWEPERDVEDGSNEAEENREQKTNAESGANSGDSVEATVKGHSLSVSKVAVSRKNATGSSDILSRSHGDDTKVPASSTSEKTPPWRSARVAAALAVKAESSQSRGQ